MKTIPIIPLIFAGMLLFISGCSKSLRGTFEPMRATESIDATGLISRPILKFSNHYVQVSHVGSKKITEYEYRITDGIVEIVIPESGNREIWKIEIAKDGSLRDGSTTWTKKE